MNKKGFTLIEIIMVIAIIAILSLILIPNVMVLIDKNKKRTCEKMIDNIELIKIDVKKLFSLILFLFVIK